MAWNESTSPVPSGGHPDQAAASTNPLIGNQQSKPQSPAGQYIETAPAPIPIRPASALTPGPAPAAAPGPVPKATSDQEQTDAHDDIWIERCKRAIAETQNDPFRQVQLIQHLNKLYLKERYGREVQGDKG